MFCRYCGREMRSAGPVCGNCKRDQKELQSTDGFFGVLHAVAEERTFQDKTRESEMSMFGVEHIPMAKAEDEQEKRYLWEQLQVRNKRITYLENCTIKLRKLLFALLTTMGCLILLTIVLLLIMLRNEANQGVRTSQDSMLTGSESENGPVEDEEVEGSVSGNNFGERIIDIILYRLNERKRDGTLRESENTGEE